jgi:TatD DNase family protein
MLDLEPFNGDLQGVIDQAKEAGVDTMLCIATDREHLPEVLGAADRFARVFATVGVHPSDSQADLLSSEQIVAMADHPKVVGIGETGLDYYYDNSDRGIQQQSFAAHIQAARELNLPLIIHTRSAQDDTISIMREEGADQCGAVMHCFTESWQMAKQALDMGFYISISGIVTFKNAHQVRDVAAKVPMDRLLVETDAPFLTPVPLRGKPNYPAYTRHVAEFIASMRGLSIEEFSEQTTQNFHRLFQRVPR